MVSVRRRRRDTATATPSRTRAMNGSARAAASSSRNAGLRRGQVVGLEQGDLGVHLGDAATPA